MPDEKGLPEGFVVDELPEGFQLDSESTQMLASHSPYGGGSIKENPYQQAQSTTGKGPDRVAGFGNPLKEIPVQLGRVWNKVTSGTGEAVGSGVEASNEKMAYDIQDAISSKNASKRDSIVLQALSGDPYARDWWDQQSEDQKWKQLEQLGEHHKAVASVGKDIRTGNEAWQKNTEAKMRDFVGASKDSSSAKVMDFMGDIAGGIGQIGVLSAVGGTPLTLGFIVNESADKTYLQSKESGEDEGVARKKGIAAGVVTGLTLAAGEAIPPAAKATLVRDLANKALRAGVMAGVSTGGQVVSDTLITGDPNWAKVPDNIKREFVTFLGFEVGGHLRQIANDVALRGGIKRFDNPEFGKGAEGSKAYAEQAIPLLNAVANDPASSAQTRADAASHLQKMARVRDLSDAILKAKKGTKAAPSPAQPFGDTQDQTTPTLPYSQGGQAQPEPSQPATPPALGTNIYGPADVVAHPAQAEPAPGLPAAPMPYNPPSPEVAAADREAQLSRPFDDQTAQIQQQLDAVNERLKTFPHVPALQAEKARLENWLTEVDPSRARQAGADLEAQQTQEVMQAAEAQKALHPYGAQPAPAATPEAATAAAVTALHPYQQNPIAEAPAPDSTVKESLTAPQTGTVPTPEQKAPVEQTPATVEPPVPAHEAHLEQTKKDISTHNQVTSALEAEQGAIESQVEHQVALEGFTGSKAKMEVRRRLASNPEYGQIRKRLENTSGLLAEHLKNRRLELAQKLQTPETVTGEADVATQADGSGSAPSPYGNAGANDRTVPGHPQVATGEGGHGGGTATDSRGRYRGPIRDTSDHPGTIRLRGQHGEVDGFLKDNGDFYLHGIKVAEEGRGSGEAHALILELAKKAKAMGAKNIVGDVAGDGSKGGVLRALSLRGKYEGSTFSKGVPIGDGFVYEISTPVDSIINNKRWDIDLEGIANGEYIKEGPSGREVDLSKAVKQAKPAETEPVESKAPETKPEATQQKPAQVDKAEGFAAPYQSLGDEIAKRAFGGEKLDNRKLQEAAARHFGDSAPSIKDIQDAVEFGVNRAILKMDIEGMTPRQIVDRLEAMTSNLPTQVDREAGANELQQYSTPPAYAYILNWAANIQKGEIALEPSAGVGGLAVWAKKLGADVLVNEFDKDRRSKLLETMPFRGVKTEDARQIDALPDFQAQRPSVVVMNPPFSSTSGNIPGARTALEGVRHINAALNLLEDGGRMVILMGDMESRHFRQWAMDQRRATDYTLMADVTVGRDVYRKYGTTFPTRVMIIDKVPRPENHQLVTGHAPTLPDLLKLLEGVRDGRNLDGLTESASDQPSGPESPVSKNESPVSTQPGGDLAGGSDRGSGSGGMGSGGGSGRGSGGVSTPKPGGLEKPGGKAADSVAPNVGGTDSGGTNQPVASDGGKPAAGNVVPEGGQPEGLSKPGASGGVDAPDAPKDRGGLKSQRKAVSKKVIGDGTWAPYKVEKLDIPGAKPHPAPLVESAGLASVELPEPKTATKLHLPEDLIKNGALSETQLEAIFYATQATDQMLPNGERKGFLVGDGTGVGKGRTIAGFITSQLNSGAGDGKAIWVSVNSSLYGDAVRDWTGLGGNKDGILNLSSYKAGSEIPKAHKGPMFVTYSTLSRKDKLETKKQSRLEQLKSWLGPDFDGAIVFDEAHKAGNLGLQKGTRGAVKASNTALAAREFQKAFPKARVLYVTATVASDPAQLGFLDRLGLWGPGKPFSGPEDLISKVGSKGLSALELLSRDMKAKGLYVSRTISFDGVGYRTEQHQLTGPQREMYTEAANAWMHVNKNLQQVLSNLLEKSNGRVDGKAKAKALSKFYGSQQRFFQSYLTSLSLPTLFKQADAALKDGHSVVIQLTETNEASQERQIASETERAKAEGEDLDMDSLELGPKEILINYVRDAFPVHRYQEVQNESGEGTHMELVRDSKGNPVIDPEAARVREALVGRLASLRMPEPALDEIIRKFGATNVAEASGRKQRRIWTDEGVQMDKRGKNAMDADIAEFQDGKRRILVFTKAANTGKSFHADMKAKNQEKRVHIVAQAGWNAQDAMQGLGRTHRTNQASAPEYVLLTTDLGGHKRFTATIARRLGQLGAIASGQREASGGGLFSERDNLESPAALTALNRWLHTLQQRGQEINMGGKSHHVTAGEFQDMTGLRLMDGDGQPLQELPEMKQFLNRILALDPDRQNGLFDSYMDTFEDQIQQDERNGTKERGTVNIDANSAEAVKEETIYHDPESGAEAKYYEVKTQEPVHFLPYEKAIDHAPGGVYLNPKTGGMVAVKLSKELRNVDGSTVYRYRAYSPTGTVRYMDLKQPIEKTAELEKVDPEKAAEEWQKKIDETPAEKEHTYHFIAGSLTDIWDRFPNNDKIDVARVQLDDGRIIMGRTMSDKEIGPALQRFGKANLAAGAMKYDAPKAMGAVLEGKHLELANGWTLTPVKRAGQPSVVLTTDGTISTERGVQKNYPSFRQETFQGRYGSEYKIVIPNTLEGRRDLATLLGGNPVVDVKDPRKGERGGIKVDALLAPILGPAKAVVAGYNTYKTWVKKYQGAESKIDLSKVDMSKPDGVNRFAAWLTAKTNRQGFDAQGLPQFGTPLWDGAVSTGTRDFTLLEHKGSFLHSPSAIQEGGIFSLQEPVHGHGRSVIAEAAMARTRQHSLSMGITAWAQRTLAKYGIEDAADAVKKAMEKPFQNYLDLIKKRDAISEKLASYDKLTGAMRDVRKALDAYNASIGDEKDLAKKVLDKAKAALKNANDEWNKAPLDQKRVDELLAERKRLDGDPKAEKGTNEHYGAISQSKIVADKIIKDLAKEHGDVRVALAVEAGTDVDAMSKSKSWKWLTDILQPNEVKVAKEIKAFMEKAKGKLESEGVPVIDKSYLHRPLGKLLPPTERLAFERSRFKPDHDPKKVKFHDRVAGSGIWFPSVYASMDSYAPMFARKLVTRELANRWDESIKDMKADGKDRLAQHTEEFLRDFEFGQDNTPALDALTKWFVLKHIAFSLSVGRKHATKIFLNIPELGLINTAKGVAHVAHAKLGDYFNKIEKTGVYSFESSFANTAKHKRAALEAHLGNRLIENALLADYDQDFVKELTGPLGYAFMRLAEQPVRFLEAIDRGVTLFASLEASRNGKPEDAERYRQLIHNTMTLNFLGLDKAGVNRWKNGLGRNLMIFQSAPTHLAELWMRNLNRPMRGIKDMANGDFKSALTKLGKGAAYFAMLGVLHALSKALFDYDMTRDLTHAPWWINLMGHIPGIKDAAKYLGLHLGTPPGDPGNVIPMVGEAAKAVKEKGLVGGAAEELTPDAAKRAFEKTPPKADRQKWGDRTTDSGNYKDSEAWWRRQMMTPKESVVERKDTIKSRREALKRKRSNAGSWHSNLP